MKVLVLVEHPGNRRIIADVLGTRYDLDVRAEEFAITDESTTGAFDLCLLDETVLRTHRQGIIDRKQAEAPAFAPFLLVSSKREGHIAPNVWQFVDEVITTPINEVELIGRTQSLLRTREMSLDLKRQKESSEERFRALFEGAPEPVVVVGADGTISQVNAAFCRVLGVESDAVHGLPFAHLGFEPRDTVDEIAGTDADRLSGETYTLEYERPDGNRRVLDLSVASLSEDYHEDGWIGVLVDVTTQRRHERDLERQNERLERFASVVSHDLRNPLSVAQGYLENALETADGAEDALMEVDRSLDRMNDLIEDVLRLARVGVRPSDRSLVSLADLAEVAWQNVDTAEATLSVDGDLEFLAEEQQLRQVFENFYRNAIEHAGETVRVTVGRLDDEPGFFVADDGPGIPRAERDRIFEHGYSTASEGTGFGLNIVVEIAEAHGWSVQAEESRAGGARFEITGVDSH